MSTADPTNGVSGSRPSTLTARTAYSFCRICAGYCGIKIDLEDDRIVQIVGDTQNPSSEGYSCTRGRHIGDFLTDPNRFLQCHRRNSGGELEPVDSDTAIREIGQQLKQIVDEHGPDSVGLFWGTGGSIQGANAPWTAAFLKALGTHKLFSILSIDQAPKWTTPWRMGHWMGGPQRVDDADIWLLAGINPLMSMWANGSGMPHGTARFRAAKERGLKFIVIDPRRTETAEFADIHLQIRPGTDAAIFAAMLRVILEENLHDAEFCRQWVTHGDLDLIREAVKPATPERVAKYTDVAAQDIVDAARLFAAGPKGMAVTGTGANMGRHSNISEQLVACLNIVCGRFARAGDPVKANILQPQMQPIAQVMPAERPWLSGYKSRFGYGLVCPPGGKGGWRHELPTITLADEILEPGDDRIRAMIIVGGNPASTVPDQEKIVRAFRELDLLVTIEPFMVETAKLAHYVLAPTLWLERAEHTGAFEYSFDGPFSQYTPAITEPPPGVRHDWQYLAGIASEMGMTLEVAGQTYAPGDPLPTAEEFAEHMAKAGQVPLGEIKRHPHGHVFSELEGAVVQPADDTSGRFQLLADDAARELEAALAFTPPREDRPFLLTCRRIRETMNTTGRRTPNLARKPYNSCYLHPDDMATLGLKDEDLVQLESDAGAIVGVAAGDPRLKRGVASMTHAYGDLPGEDSDPRKYGANVGRLISSENLQSITGMPWMTAIPVTLCAVEDVDSHMA